LSGVHFYPAISAQLYCAIDNTDLQVVTGFKISQNPVHDIPHAEKLLKQCQRTRKSDIFVMDKGYDSEDIHRLIRDELQSYSIIPVKTRKRKKIMGYYRRELSRYFDTQTYNRRNLVETAFSVMKRKFGDCLKSRKYRNQVKEIKIKLILYNICKIPQSFFVFIVIEEFYRA
jgi:transposase